MLYRYFFPKTVVQYSVCLDCYVNHANYNLAFTSNQTIKNLIVVKWSSREIIALSFSDSDIQRVIKAFSLVNVPSNPLESSVYLYYTGWLNCTRVTQKIVYFFNQLPPVRFHQILFEKLQWNAIKLGNFGFSRTS